MSSIPVAIQRSIVNVQDIIRARIDSIGYQAHLPNLFDQVRVACLDGKAFIFMLPEGDSFVVLRPMSNSIVQIWIAYSKEGNATEQYLPTIKNLCREIGATEIEFETSLESMERLMPKHGWVKKHTVWRQTIDE
jgi:hypothetical protein